MCVYLKKRLECTKYLHLNAHELKTNKTKNKKL